LWAVFLAASKQEIIISLSFCNKEQGLKLYVLPQLLSQSFRQTLRARMASEEFLDFLHVQYFLERQAKEKPEPV